MYACTTETEAADTEIAIADATRAIVDALGHAPDFVIAAYGEAHDARAIHAKLSEAFPRAALIGTSTCRGVMTERGLFGFGKPVLALAAFSDPDAAFGTAGLALEGDLPSAIDRAIEEAQAAAGRAGEVPDMVWLHASPGREEELIAGIQASLGADVLISGGSSADECIGGLWSQFTTSGLADGAAIALLYADQPITHHFQSGYLPTDLTGEVTRARGRTLYEIDHRPAAEIYNHWADGAISEAIRDRSRNILGDSAWKPLGKSIGRIGPSPELMVDCYCLVHPDSVGPDGELRLFADVEEGSRVVLMRSGPEELTKRATQVVRTSFEMTPAGTGVGAALMVFCAGCMLALGDDIQSASAEIRAAFGDVPFLGVFTFGEQGSFLNGDRLHGNLMISTTLLGSAVPAT